MFFQTKLNNVIYIHQNLLHTSHHKDNISKTFIIKIVLKQEIVVMDFLCEGSWYSLSQDHVDRSASFQYHIKLKDISIIC